MIDVRPYGASLVDTQTTTLVKTKSLEIIRMVIPAGKKVAEHSVQGEVVVQCLEGKIAFNCGGTQQELEAGHLLFLDCDEPHSLQGLVDASLLVTILLGSTPKEISF